MREPNQAIVNTISLIVGSLLVVAGCSRERVAASEIDLPSTPILSLEANWSVIVSSHLRLREQPSIESRVITTLWRGYVLEVLSKQNTREEVDGEADFWYQVRHGGLQGWVFGSYLGFHSSYEAAATAGEKLRE